MAADVDLLKYQNEVLAAENGVLHSFIHGLCLQLEKHGHLYTDGTGAIGIETGLFYSSALSGASFEEDFKQDILWVVPADQPYALDQEEI